MLWTLNPDSPDLAIYDKYINHARPIDKYINQYPQELLEALNKEPKAGYRHWYCTFDDNIACTQEKKQKLIDSVPIGSKRYKNKILGIRGHGEGMLYEPYMHDEQLIDYLRIDADALEEVICSVDMGTATASADNKHAHTIASIVGFSRKYQRVVVLETAYIPSNDIDFIVDAVDKLLLPYWANYFRKLTKIVIDYGDSGQLLVRTWKKRTRLKGVIVKACVKTGNVQGTKKAINLQSRAQLKCQLLMGDYLLWTDRAKQSFIAHQNIMANKNDSEQDMNNIHNDYADSLTYALTEKWLKVSNLIKEN